MAKLTELNMPPFCGQLNTNVLLHAPYNGGVFLQRNPHENRTIVQSLAHEYAFLGFTQKGGKFRRRTQEEQTWFCSRAAGLGLRVLPPMFTDGKGRNYFPFIEKAKTLNQHLPLASTNAAEVVVAQLFSDLQLAHQLGIVYGDRWSENMLIDPSFGLVHIDFDLEISGPPAVNFEVAQAAYYTLCGGKEKILPILAAILKNGNGWFNFNEVANFIIQHALHFKHSAQYGGVDKEIQALIDLVLHK